MVSLTFNEQKPKEDTISWDAMVKRPGLYRESNDYCMYFFFVLPFYGIQRAYCVDRKTGNFSEPHDGWRKQRFIPVYGQLSFNFQKD